MNPARVKREITRMAWSVAGWYVAMSLVLAGVGQDWYDLAARSLVAPGVGLGVLIVAIFFWRAVRVTAMDARRCGRIEAGACPECGYDRAGLGDETPCPECGA